MDLPRHYNEKLQRAFPELRMRWSGMFECWQLEKQINRRRTVDPSTYPAAAVDSFIRFRDGYDLVEEFHPQRLPSVDRLVEGLRFGSITRIMEELGFKHSGQLADYYDERDRARKEYAWRKAKERNKDFAAEEFYDRMAWMEGRRAVVPKRWEELTATPNAADYKLAERIAAATQGAEA